MFRSIFNYFYAVVILLMAALWIYHGRTIVAALEASASGPAGTKNAKIKARATAFKRGIAICVTGLIVLIVASLGTYVVVGLCNFGVKQYLIPVVSAVSTVRYLVAGRYIYRERKRVGGDTRRDR